MITPAYSLTSTERVLPRLALDFTTAALDPRITVARALNTATRVNSSGLIETVNADLPRFDYTLNTGGVCKGLLIEETRANLLQQSSAFNEAVWVSAAGGTGVLPAITPNYDISPDGTQNADRVILDSGAAGYSQLGQSVGNVSTPHTYSIFLKSLSGDVTVTLFALASVKNVTVTSTWQRFDFVRSISTSTAAEVRIVKRDIWNSTGVADLLVYGAQLEAGAFPTSYIPTTTTSLTRNADVVSMTGANFSSWYNASEGTFYVQGVPTTTASSGALSIDDGTSNQRMQVRALSGGGQAAVVDGGVTQANIATGTWAANVKGQCVFAYKVNNFACAAGGATAGTDTAGTVPTVNNLKIGGSAGLNQAYFNGAISKVSYWPQRCINVEVQAFSKG